MIEFLCDNCGKRKTGRASWIYGVALENEGVTSVRREVAVANAWDEAGARDLFAVHFCSDDCKDAYVEKVVAEPVARKATVVKMPARQRAVSPQANKKSRSTSARSRRTTQRRKRA